MLELTRHSSTTPKNKTSLCVLHFVTLERNLASLAVLVISKEVLGLNLSQDTVLNEIFNGLCSSPNIVWVIKSRRMRWAGHVARMGEEMGVYRVLLGKPEGRRPLGRPRHRWVDNIRMDLQEVGCGYMDWIGLAQDRDRWRTLVSAVINLRVP